MLRWAPPLLALACATSRVDEVARYLERAEAGGFSGAALVAVRGKVVLARGYGLADRARGVRADEKTRFLVASISKTLTAGWGRRGAGGLVTTVVDLHRWVVALDGRLLPRAILDEMLAREVRWYLDEDIVTVMTATVMDGEVAPIGIDGVVSRCVAALLFGRCEGT